MATATLRKIVSNPAARAALAARAKSGAKRLAEGAKRRYRSAAPAIKRDVVDGLLIPGAIGTAGAIGADVLLDRFAIFGGAKGDIAKLGAGLLLGVANQQTLRNRHVHTGVQGIVIVNAYKVATRLMNRAVSGKGLAGFIDDNSNSDLAGYLGNVGSYEPVAISFADGTSITGWRDGLGNLYDGNGALIVYDGDQLQGIPYEQIPAVSPPVRLANGALVN